MKIPELEAALSAARSAAATSQELTAASRSAQSESIDEVKELKRAAASGEPVDATAMVVANAELEIRSARLATLEGEEAQAVAEVNRLEHELITTELLAEFAEIATKRAAAEKKAETAKAAWEKAQADAEELAGAAHRKLLNMGLPLVEAAGDEDGELGHPDRWNRRVINPLVGHGRPFRIGGRVYGPEGEWPDPVQKNDSTWHRKPKAA